ncbi:hypothetical protein NEA10_15005 [Phormidium yuhuli AB48]|uniref:Uncharacterized protein n=1 Tax=Phormidium yuhuli AB48 TaxID=2940671 RepID=A0ABY5AP54_9CYAN|nr:hypothetical protein [Phormidium yuhuli]USR90146.1 hypothetical protein NEA10_15005 [Phormidium yuhuli AB48]
MASQPDWQRKLQELEQDIDRKLGDRSQSQETFNTTPLPEQTQTTISSLYHQAKTWFQTLPTIGQVAVGIGTVVLSLSVLQTVMRLVTLGISLAVIAVVGYMGYRLFFAPNDSPEA